MKMCCLSKITTRATSVILKLYVAGGPQFWRIKTFLDKLTMGLNM